MSSQVLSEVTVRLVSPSGGKKKKEHSSPVIFLLYYVLLIFEDSKDKLWIPVYNKGC